MDDKFILSVGQAHELQHAFNRSGWTAEQVHKLCEGDVLRRLHKDMFKLPLLNRPLYEIFTKEAASRQGIRHGGASIEMILNSNRYVTVRDLLFASERELLNIPNLGRKYVDAIKGILSTHGLHLRTGPD